MGRVAGCEVETSLPVAAGVGRVSESLPKHETAATKSSDANSKGITIRPTRVLPKQRACTVSRRCLLDGAVWEFHRKAQNERERKTIARVRAADSEARSGKIVMAPRTPDHLGNRCCAGHGLGMHLRAQG